MINTGNCSEAIELKGGGQISCLDVCPQDCDICNMCISQICPSPTPSPVSGPPGSDPTLSPGPSVSPTLEPTAAFDVSACASYSRDWLLDLAATCGQIGPVDVSNTCECSGAERKINSGQIVCGVDICPADCAICQFCLYDILDCLPMQTRRKRVSNP